jgi:hypothetical protein
LLGMGVGGTGVNVGGGVAVGGGVSVGGTVGKGVALGSEVGVNVAEGATTVIATSMNNVGVGDEDVDQGILIPQARLENVKIILTSMNSRRLLGGVVVKRNIKQLRELAEIR